MTRDKWSDYDEIGPGRSLWLGQMWDTPRDYVAECEYEAEEDAPAYAALDAPKLTKARGIGLHMANQITSQMWRDLTDQEEVTA